MKTARTRESAVAGFFARLTRFVYAVVCEGFFGRVMTAYAACNAYLRSSGVGRLFTKISHGKKAGYRSVRRSVAQSIDRSYLRRGVSAAFGALLACNLRTIGLFFVTCGTYSALSYWLFSVIWSVKSGGPIYLYIGFAELVIGILLLFFDLSLGYALDHSFFFGVLVHFFGISEEAFKESDRTGRQGYAVAVPLGMLAGALGVLIKPQYAFLGILLFFIFLLEFSVPEAGVILLIAAIPFVGFLSSSFAFMFLLTLLAVAAYFAKVLRGNRVFRMDLQDFVVLLLLIYTALITFFDRGVSAKSAVLEVALVGIYFIVSNGIATRQWLRRARGTLVLSATAAAVVGIAQFIVAAVLDSEKGATIATLGRAVHCGFSGRIPYAAFLVLAFPFALSFLIGGKKHHRLLFGFSVLSILAALVLTWVQSAWLAVFFATILFFLVFDKRTFPFFLSAGILAPLVRAMVPTSSRAFLLRLFHMDAEVALARGSAVRRIYKEARFFRLGSGGKIRFFREVLLGLGRNGIAQFSAFYTALPADTAEETLSFWYYRLLEGGVIGVLLPAALFFFLLQNCFSLLAARRGETRSVWPIAGIAAVVGAIVIGIFHYTWYDYSAMGAFFAVIALIGADARYERSTMPNDVESGGNSPYSAEISYYRVD